MTEENKKSFPWAGLLFLVLGVILLLNQLNIINVLFSQIIWGLLIIVGFIYTIRGYKYNIRHKVFWGTVIFLFSLYFLLNSLDLIDYHYRIFLPSFFLIFGFAFLTTYLINIKDVWWLIISLLLISSGMFLILEDFGYFNLFDVRSVIKTYWPIVLILFGLGLLFRKRL